MESSLIKISHLWNKSTPPSEEKEKRVASKTTTVNLPASNLKEIFEDIQSNTNSPQKHLGLYRTKSAHVFSSTSRHSRKRNQSIGSPSQTIKFSYPSIEEISKDLELSPEKN